MKFVALLLVAAVTGAAASAQGNYFQQLAAKRAEVVPLVTDYSVLENGVQLYLLSTPNAKQSGISMRIGSGQYQAPAAYRGLAHYLEHCEFLGSERYPIPSDAMKFAEQAQGYVNAFTGARGTNYQILVNTEALDEAADRLSDMVVAPLFNETAIGKELNAIQSEYDKNEQNPGWQAMYLADRVLKDDHPAALDFQGNKQTLGNVPRAVMQKFFDENYSSKNAVVVIESSQPIAKLKELAQRTFGRIPARPFARAAIAPQYLSRKRPATFIKGSMLQDKAVLALRYMLPPVKAGYFSTKDYDMVENAISDMQEGSFGDTLVRKGWLNGIEAGDTADDPTGNNVQINLDLTKEGYKHWQEIASGVLAQIEFLKKTGYSADLFKNTQRTDELKYLYTAKSPEQDAVQIAELQGVVGPHETRERIELIGASSAATYTAAVNALTTDKLDVVLLAPDIKGDLQSDFYNISYTMENLADQPWVKQPQTLAGFTPKAPGMNPFMPQSLDVVAQNDATPVMVASTPLLTASVQRDNTFRMPKGNIAIRIQYGEGYKATPLDAMLNRVFVNYIGQALNGWLFAPQQIGYVAKMANEQRGLDLVLSGYSDRLPNFTNELVKRVASIKIDADTYAAVMAATQFEVQNSGVGDATDQGLHIRALANDPLGYSDLTEAGVLAQVTPELLADFQKRVLSSGQIRILGFGSLTVEQMKGLAAQIETSVGMTVGRITPTVAMEAPLGTTSYAATRDGSNNLWFTGFDFGALTADSSARARLVAALVGQPFFAHMRTDKNYGYIVEGYASVSTPVAKVGFLVQSTVDSVEVATEGRRWLKEDFLPQLTSMSDADFAQVRAALVTKLRQAPASFDEKFAPLQQSLLVDGAPSPAAIADVAEKLTKEAIVADVRDRIVGDQHREFQLYLNSKALPAIPAGEKSVKTLEEYWALKQLAPENK